MRETGEPRGPRAGAEVEVGRGPGRAVPPSPGPGGISPPISRGRKPLHPRLCTPDPSRPSPGPPSPHQPAAQNLTVCQRQISVPRADFIPGPWRVQRGCGSSPWRICLGRTSLLTGEKGVTELVNAQSGCRRQEAGSKTAGRAQPS
ncbi:vegetative cell wall protein gp1-like isoform X1 [Neomonachus schauinslandi]|uniref:Vegetative cell wall protein gp1-like isoform X1 n=1 Tax=Neomonachus schauinslandi TaxID=29088 RepID=A0A2Y9H7E0_NEOSC|nr:vegetative cell wall protein gp1-like isoform X1 [Neomonachus schauinslandi]